MLIARWSNFLGCAPMVQVQRLAEGLGVYTANLRLGFGDLRPWRAPSTVVTTGGLTPLISAYRANRAVASDTQYWWQWTTDVDVVRTLVATDTSEEIYYTGDGAPKSTDLTIGLPPGPGPASSRTMGIPAPTIIGAVALNVEGTGDNESRAYLNTFINDRNRESAPSPVRSIVVKGGSTISLTGLPPAPSGNHGIDRRRIYCSTDGGDYLLVVEQGATLTTAADGGSRGSVLQTGGDVTKPAWLEPPADLKGLVMLWNGMLGGHFGKTYAASVPGRPWAWPIEHQDTLFDQIVGSAVYGQNWVVLTTSQPIVLRGGPVLFDRQPIDLQQACVSKRSITSVGHGVCYAGPSGLCYVGSNGPARILTEGIVSPEQWSALVPSTIVGNRIERYYIGFYNDGTPKGFMLDTLNPSGIIFLTFGAKGTHYDPISDRLYLLGDGNTIQRWNAGSLLTVDHRTGVVRHPYETNPGYALVVAEEPESVQFTLFAEVMQADRSRVWTTVFDSTVTTGEAFALPGDYLARDFQVRIRSVNPTQGVLLAEEIEDLT